MLPLDEIWNLREWHDWLLQECGMAVGRDYRWAWANNRWAIEFTEPRDETLVRLKMAAR